MLDNTLSLIEKWLRQHAKRLVKLSLRPPASKAALLKLEEAVGKPLPADFKQLYRWHDGLTDEENVGSLFYGLDFWPLSRVLPAYQSRVASTSSMAIPRAALQLNAANFFNPSWLQFCSDDSRAGLFLDLAPGSTGTYGQVIFLDPTYEAGLLVATSITELVEQFQADLAAGSYSLEPDALADGEHFLLPNDSINLLNWHHSLRWQRPE